MQSVTAAFTAEEKDVVRKIAQNLLVSWKKFSTLGNRTFTIGVSLIGGNDVIGINPGAVGSPGNWKYFDESDYLTEAGWERSLPMPLGGLSKALAEARLDNTSGRFTPRYMGGNSELFTAILPRRPVIINAGFDYGIEDTLPQFAGVFSRPPEVDTRSKEVSLMMEDYMGFFQNRKLDQTVMFTGLRTDQVIENAFTQLGMSTSQYELDYGINIIPFGLFEAGIDFWDMLNQIVQAENGYLYQDEQGIFRFENRQHWDNSPHNAVQRIIATFEVLSTKAPDYDNLINSVEVVSKVRAKQPNQLLFKLGAPLELLSESDTTLFVDFDDPILELDTPQFYSANTLESGEGSDITNSISVKSIDKFAKATKIVFSNNGSVSGFLTELSLYGRPAKVISDLYYRAQDDSSVTAYEERPFRIENNYIQNVSWANSLSQMILRDYSEPENIQEITIRAIPELQFGDLISWQGRYWRVFGINSEIRPEVGFIQKLTLLQRTVTAYFRIGLSTIGGTDRIAP